MRLSLASLWATLALLGPALLMTLAIEIPVGMLRGLRSAREIGAVALVNLITNPLLNYVVLVLYISGRMGASGGWAYWGTIALLELLVVLAEWRMLLWALGGSSRRMLITSVLMNAASFGLGLAIAALRPALGFWV
jgi:hypothetical protein